MEIEPLLINDNYCIRDGQILCQNPLSGENIFIDLDENLCGQLNISTNLIMKDINENAPDLEVTLEPQAGPAGLQKNKQILNKTKWTVVATKQLIEVYTEKKDMFKSGFSNDEIWENITNRMLEFNYNFNPTQLRNKFYNLKKQYTKRKDCIRQTGAAPVDFDYWDEFQAIFSKDHNVTQ